MRTTKEKAADKEIPVETKLARARYLRPSQFFFACEIFCRAAAGAAGRQLHRSASAARIELESKIPATILFARYEQIRSRSANEERPPTRAPRRSPLPRGVDSLRRGGTNQARSYRRDRRAGERPGHHAGRVSESRAAIARRSGPGLSGLSAGKN